MTHYDQLIDSIVDEIYWVWTEISDWDNEETQQDLKETAHRILQHVEEFQTVRTNLKQWRATD
jgi:hypothetical protein